MTVAHVHTAVYMPPSGGGYAVCSCGATCAMSRGVLDGVWHACRLCSHHPDPPVADAAKS